MAYLIKDVKKTFQGYTFFVYEGCFRESVVSLIEYGGGQISETISEDTIKIARYFTDVPNFMNRCNVFAADYITDSLVKGCMLHPYGYILCNDYKYTPTFAPNFLKFYAEFEAERGEKSQPVGESDDNNTNNGPVIEPGDSENLGHLKKVNGITNSNEKLNTTSKKKQDSKSKDSIVESKVSKKTCNMQKVNTITDSDEEVNTTKQLEDKDDDAYASEEEPKVSNKTRKNTKTKVNMINDSDDEVNTSKQPDDKDDGSEEEPEVGAIKTRKNTKKVNYTINDSDEEMHSSKQPDSEDDDDDELLKVFNKSKKHKKKLDMVRSKDSVAKMSKSKQQDSINDSDEEMHSSKQPDSEDDDDDELLKVFNQSKKHKKKLDMVRSKDSVAKMSKSKQQDSVNDSDEEMHSEDSVAKMSKSKQQDSINDSDEEMHSSKQPDSEDDDDDELLKVFNKSKKHKKKLDMVRSKDSVAKMSKSKQQDSINDSDEEVNSSTQPDSGDDDDEELLKVFNQSKKHKKELDMVGSKDSVAKMTKSKQQDSELEGNEEEPEKRTRNFKKSNPSKYDVCNKTRKNTKKKVNTINDSDDEVNTSKQLDDKDDGSEDEPEVSNKTRKNTKIFDTINDSDDEVNTSKQLDGSEEEPEVGSNKTRKNTKIFDTINDSDDEVNTSKQLDGSEEEPEVGSNKTRKNTKIVDTINDYDDEVNTSKQLDGSEEEPEVGSNKTRKNTMKVDAINESDEEANSSKQPDSEDDGDEEVLKVFNQSKKHKKKLDMVRSKDSVAKMSKSKQQDSINDSDEEVNSSKQPDSEDDDDEELLKVLNQSKKHKKKLDMVGSKDSVAKMSKSKQHDSEVEDNEEEPEVSTKRTRNFKKSNPSNDVCNNEPTHSRWLNAKSSTSVAYRRPETEKLLGIVELSASEGESEELSNTSVDLFQSVGERRKKRNQFKNTSRVAEMTGSDEEFLQEAKVASKSVVPVNTLFRQPFSKDEKNRIVMYICDNNLHDQVKGNALWQKMEKKKVMRGRTWQSLREHFIKKILPKIDSFEKVLGKEEIQLFKNVLHNKEPKSQSKYKSLEFTKEKRALQEEDTVHTASSSKETHGTKRETAVDKVVSYPKSMRVTLARIIESSSQVLRAKSSPTNSRDGSTTSSRKDTGGTKSKDKDVEVSPPNRSGGTRKSSPVSSTSEKSPNTSPSVSPYFSARSKSRYSDETKHATTVDEEVSPPTKSRRTRRLSSSSSVSELSTCPEDVRKKSPSKNRNVSTRSRNSGGRKIVTTDDEEVPLPKKLCVMSFVASSPVSESSSNESSLITSHVSSRANVSPRHEDTVEGNFTTIGEKVKNLPRTRRATYKSLMWELSSKKDGSSARDSGTKIRRLEPLLRSSRDSSEEGYEKELHAPNVHTRRARSGDRSNNIRDG